MYAFRKIIRTLLKQIRSRGLISTIAMNRSQLFGGLRGLIYKLLYFRNINASIFTIQANSTIEMFNKQARMKIGSFVFIRKNASIRIDFDGQLTLGEKVFINDNCNINCVNKITIGKGSKIAPNVCINDHDHNYKSEDGEHLLKGEVIIGCNVWIGSNVVILRDTFIGDNAVIAAGSVVKGIVPADTLFLNKRENKYVGFKEPKSSINNLFQVKESI
ncbi:acyltransferase [Candidatus Pristimantibacillus sp. PTI5]|uniref:acyltransferase n=1 Tax=Candidatus Pristimantibacillus sp. PTI5 TaxID=3400422 RepID=UPI003B01B005